MTAAAKLSLASDRDRTLEALATSSIGRKALSEQAALTLEKRNDLAAELARLDKTAARDLPKLRAEVDAALAEFNEVQKSFYGASAYDSAARAPAAAAGLLAQERIRVAQRKCTAASFAYSGRRDEIERELRRTASPAIALFIREMRDAWNVARRTPVTVRPPQLNKNPVTGKSLLTIESNARSITARMNAIREAMASAEAIALEPDQTDVDIKLGRLRQTLPAIGGPELRK